MSSFGTASGSTFTFTVPTEKGDRAPESPSGLIATRAVETKHGWRGQVYVDKTIVWEGAPLESGGDAVQAANTQVVKAITRLFELTEEIDNEVTALAGDDE